MSVISERLDSPGPDQDQAADDAVRAMCQFAQRVLAQSKKFFVSECASQAFASSINSRRHQRAVRGVHCCRAPKPRQATRGTNRRRPARRHGKTRHPPLRRHPMQPPCHPRVRTEADDPSEAPERWPQRPDPGCPVGVGSTSEECRTGVGTSPMPLTRRETVVSRPGTGSRHSQGVEIGGPACGSRPGRSVGTRSSAPPSLPRSPSKGSNYGGPTRTDPSHLVLVVC